MATYKPAAIDGLLSHRPEDEDEDEAAMAPVFRTVPL